MSGAMQPKAMVSPPPDDSPVTYTWFGSIAYCGLVTKRLISLSSTASWPDVRLWLVLA